MEYYLTVLRFGSLTFFLLITGLTSCSLQSPSGVEVRWNLPSTRNPSFNGMDCFFLSVSAEDIAEEAGDLGSSVDESCLGLGRVSPIIDRSTLVSEGITLSVPRGTNRKIRAMGMRVPGGSCQDSLEAQFGQSLPELYALGEVSANLTTATTVEIPNQIASAVNLVNPPCAQVKEFLFFADGSNEVNRITVDPLTGQPQSTAINEVASSAQGQCLDPLGEYVGFVATTQFRLCPLAKDGSLPVLPTTNCPAVIHPSVGTGCGFSADGEFFYLSMDNSGTKTAIYRINRSTDLLEFVDTEDLSFSSLGTNMNVLNSFLYSDDFSAVEVHPRNPQTGLLGPGVVAGPAITNLAFHPFLSVGYGRVSGGIVTLQSASMDESDGSLTPTSSKVLGMDTGGDIIDLCLSPSGQTVYALLSKPPNYEVWTVETDGGGLLGTDTLRVTLTGGTSVQSCAVHHSGRTLFVGRQNEIRPYSIASDGTFTALTTISTPGASQAGFVRVAQ